MKSASDLIDKERRSFLEFLGKAGVGTAVCRAVPLIGGLMATRRARAQSSARRVVFVYAGNGAPNGLWLPSGSRLNRATQAYEGLQSICNFREVEVINSGHGLSRKCLGALRWDTNWTGDTIDQQIASVLGTSTPYPSYALGVETNPQELIGRKGGAIVPAQDNPAAAYRQLFSGNQQPQGDGNSQKRSMLDQHRQDITRMKNRLGSFERETLDKHETAIREIESRLESSSSPSSSSCSSPSWNSNGYPTSNSPNVPFGHKAELQSDIIVRALQCGLTNVMTLQLGWDQGLWYAHNTQYKGDHHGSCHAASAQENAEMTNYMSGSVAYLIRRLMNENDPSQPGSRMIDSTVVVQVTDMGNGQDHSPGNGPNMVATRMPSFRRGTVRSGGNNYNVLEAVVEGLGLGAYKGTNVNQHRIWPCANGRVDTSLLA